MYVLLKRKLALFYVLITASSLTAVAFVLFHALGYRINRSASLPFLIYKIAPLVQDAEIKRGDCVIIDLSQISNPIIDRGVERNYVNLREPMLKLIGAIPGDTVVLRDGYLFVNGDTTKIIVASHDSSGEKLFAWPTPITLQHGQYWLISDPARGFDSRDFVFEVPLKTKGTTWILLHIEAQGPGGDDLSERMYHYKCLIYSHYRREPVALAIITSGHRKKERFYSHSHFGTETIYRYNNLVLEDLNEKELKISDNPIDLALYAAKCSLKAKKEIQKYKYLRTLAGLLAERGWEMKDKQDLLFFLERVIDLRDKEFEKQYTEYRDQLSKEGKIVYIPLGERELAKEIEQRGIEKGMEKGKEEVLRKLLKNGVSPDVIAQSTDMPVERVRTLMN